MNRNRGYKFLPVIWAGIFGLVLVFACTKIDYVGESYAPTSQVDMYFSEDEVTIEYRVMGRMVAHANDAVSAEKMQKKMMKKAREKGADGIIIDVHPVPEQAAIDPLQALSYPAFEKLMGELRAIGDAVGRPI